MANQIAKVNYGGVSTWDVKFEIKEGAVDLPNPWKKWLGRMLSDDTEAEPKPGLTWVESMRELLRKFHEHIIGGTSVFYDVPALHFLKLAMTRESVGGVDRYFLTFNTEFHDPTENEQEYIDDMYHKYGPYMVVLWLHCKDVVGLLEGGDKEVPAPPPPVPAIPPLCPMPPPGGYKLSQAFLNLVEANQMDNVLPSVGAPTERAHCFFVANKGASPANIKSWKNDSARLSSAATAVQSARNAAQVPGSDKALIFDALMQTLEGLNI